MISVCMAVFNGEKFIKQQIDSILSQLKEDDEIIISDDGSSDKTLVILSAFKDERIKIFHHSRIGKNNLEKCTNNFEYCLSKASGEFVYLADQDDIWRHDKVRVCNELLEHFDVVISNQLYINEVNKELDYINLKKNKVYGGLIKNLIKNSYVGSCMCFKKTILHKALPFPKNILLHDCWLGMVAEAFYNVKIVSDNLVYHRIHDNNLSSTGFKSNLRFEQKLLLRYHLVKGIISKI